MTQIPDAASRTADPLRSQRLSPARSAVQQPLSSKWGASDTTRRGFLLLLPGIQEQRVHRHHGETTCGVYLQTCLVLDSGHQKQVFILHKNIKKKRNSQEDTGKSLCRVAQSTAGNSTHPSWSRLPTLLPTHPSLSRLPTLLPTHPSPSQLLTLLPTNPSLSRLLTLLPTHRSQSRLLTLLPTHPSRSQLPTAPQRCPEYPHGNTAPVVQNPKAGQRIYPPKNLNNQWPP